MIESKGLYQAFERKIIYAFSIDNKDGKLDYYDGYEKVGEASVPNFKMDYRDESPDLLKAAEKRIKQYAGTSGLPFKVDISRLAITKDNKFFRDYDVHEVLRRSGIKKAEFGNGNEWFKTDVSTVIKAIEAVEDGRSTINNSNSTNIPKNNFINKNDIVFRDEQRIAIDETIKVFKNKSRMLWNAKMRFGKTLTALQVVKESKFKRTLILTHRPIVSDEWFEDFGKIFSSKDDYIFGSKKKGEKLNYLINNDKHFVYFASIQDLRGQINFGGKYQTENNAVSEIDWDFVIIDEAHEGTRTEITHNIYSKIVGDAKVLELSGTPFNILDEYEESQVFTWDYVMEQEAKYSFKSKNDEESNPYEMLPKMNMFTFSLSEKFKNKQFINIEDKAFNFSEFFKVDKETKDFVYQREVKNFLDEITKPNSKNNYPFSNAEFRNNLRHTLWLLPSVDSCRAMKKMLEVHSVFGHEFKIVNVVENGDELAKEDDLKKVRNAITNSPSKTKTITLTVRKLTTGVNVKEWTGVMFLNNTNSPAAYLQAAFRAQTPFLDEKLGMKTNAFIFDFAPDRALTIMSNAAKFNSGVGKKTSNVQKEHMKKFLNFLPILGSDGNGMEKYDVRKLLTKLKRVYAEKAVRTGFEDDSLYNDELLTLTEADLSDFKDLKAIIGSSYKTSTLPKKIDVNNQGLTDEEYEQAENGSKKNKNKRTPEEQQALEKLKAAKKQRKVMISILRGISIRIPMMIYGMEVDIDEDVDIDTFIEKIDYVSWEEFMPKGVTKTVFKKYKKYYDPEVFIEAGFIIRRKAKSFDKMEYSERTEKIAELFSSFKNPDKETVLTPWRVVNLQLGKSIGGLNFFDKNFKSSSTDIKEITPHWINTKYTDQVIKNDSKILEINSKTGLYPLYVATSLYFRKLQILNEDRAGKFNRFDEEDLIKSILKNNIYVVAKTPMAKTITDRTIKGFNNWESNVVYLKSITEKLKNNIDEVKYEIQRKFNNMKFDVVIGNPPYQEKTIGNNITYTPPIYHKFLDLSYQLSDLVCMITPGRFLFNAGKTPKNWNKQMLEDIHLKVLHYESNSKNVFPNNDIKGGVAVTLRNANENFGSIGTFSVYDELMSISKKVSKLTNEYLSNIVSGRGVYKLSKKALEDFPEIIKLQSEGHKQDIGTGSFEILKNILFFEKVEANNKDNLVKIIGLEKVENTKVRKELFVERKYISVPDSFNYYKVALPKANGTGKFGETLSKPIILTPNEGHTDTFLTFGSFKSKNEAEALSKYIKTKFVRALLGLFKVTQDNTKYTWSKVPLQNFTSESDINWEKSVEEIDKQLFEKYKLNYDEINFVNSKIKIMS
ncbi:Eco57I restriction-modification methylase domain-containing protein [Staphylococcus simulans]|uniref:Eco57I restriction-modification methylase domain-containing protein n=1 Tax=Staphylococcus simulans TaxID=1286 RepID=UPI001E40D0CA|nr:Eco57I restriction-modification methylase domain-containing protein [Staphylococcus simulans]MCD8914662.1 Eco57I restriction-modification methylase domain-containing protein [Staphylococcus simulans]